MCQSLNVPINLYNELLESAKAFEDKSDVTYNLFEVSFRSWELDCTLTYHVVAKPKADAKKALEPQIKEYRMVDKTLDVSLVKTIGKSLVIDTNEGSDIFI